MPVGGDGHLEAGRAFPVWDGFADLSVGDPARLYEHGPNEEQDHPQPQGPGGDFPVAAQTVSLNNMEALSPLLVCLGDVAVHIVPTAFLTDEAAAFVQPHGRAARAFLARDKFDLGMRGVELAVAAHFEAQPFGAGIEVNGRRACRGRICRAPEKPGQPGRAAA